MKRRVISCFLAILLLCMSGCAAISSSQGAFSLYYRAAEVSFQKNGLIDSEKADQSLERTAEALAARYFEGPQAETLVSPFPKGTELVSSAYRDGVLYLELSEVFSNLSGADLSVALACISLTFSQLERVEAVEVSISNELIDGKESIRLKNDQFLFSDNSLEKAENTLSIYYADEENRYLIATEVKTKLETVKEQAVYAISLLGASPEQETLHATLPENTEILDLSVEDGLCIIDFSGDFYRNRPKSDASERMMVLSIVNTLTEFDDIESVQMLVEGEALTTFYHMDLSMTFVRDETAVGPVRAGLNEIDSSLYVLRKNDWTLTEIPMRVKSAVNETASDAVMSALLTYGERNGYLTPIPAGTEILSLTENGNHCYVDLSQSFADGLTTEESELLAVQAIVSSLTSLEDIGYVSITIEGEAGGLDYVDLDRVFQ